MESVFTRFRRRIIGFNAFQSGSSEVETVQQELWSTRLYLTLLFIALMVLVIYTAFGIQTVHVVVNDPSVTTYEALQLKYETLKCPCSQIAVNYGSFIQIEPIYHSVR
jgi:hypothetical protein